MDQVCGAITLNCDFLILCGDEYPTNHKQLFMVKAITGVSKNTENQTKLRSTSQFNVNASKICSPAINPIGTSLPIMWYSESKPSWN